jgi:serine/threonine protein kinase
MLAAGSALGPYKIFAFLGAAGVGGVHRGHDTRLGWDVALKVLPHLAASPEVRARFEREARAILQFNHPRICTLHDVARNPNLPGPRPRDGCGLPCSGDESLSPCREGRIR